MRSICLMFLLMTSVNSNSQSIELRGGNNLMPGSNLSVGYEHYSNDLFNLSAIHEEMHFNYSSSVLEELMDKFDWSKTLYDPLEANTEIENFEDKIAFNRLEFLEEQVSSFTQTSERAGAFTNELMQRHWTDTPMEAQIDMVLKGAGSKGWIIIIITYQ